MLTNVDFNTPKRKRGLLRPLFPAGSLSGCKWSCRSCCRTQAPTNRPDNVSKSLYFNPSANQTTCGCLVARHPCMGCAVGKVGLTSRLRLYINRDLAKNEVTRRGNNRICTTSLCCSGVNRSHKYRGERHAATVGNIAVARGYNVLAIRIVAELDNVADEDGACSSRCQSDTGHASSITSSVGGRSACGASGGSGLHGEQV